jgi:hypothetical protein
MNVLFTLIVKLKVSLCLNKHHVVKSGGTAPCILNLGSIMRGQLRVTAALLVGNCCICGLGTDNAFPPVQVLKEYCRAEAMSVVTGVISCTAVERTQRNLLFWLPGGTDSLRVPWQAWETSNSTEYNHYTIRPKQWRDLQRFTKIQIKNIILIKNNALGKRDLHRFQLKEWF